MSVMLDVVMLGVRAARAQVYNPNTTRPLLSLCTLLHSTLRHPPLSHLHHASVAVGALLALVEGPLAALGGHALGVHAVEPAALVGVAVRGTQVDRLDGGGVGGRVDLCICGCVGGQGGRAEEVRSEWQQEEVVVSLGPLCGTVTWEPISGRLSGAPAAGVTAVGTRNLVLSSAQRTGRLLRKR